MFYDPMLAKVISYAPIAPSGRRDCWPTRWPAPAFTACAPTATCWSTCCAIRRSSTARPTPRSSTPTAWPNWPSPLADDRAVELSALAAALADAAENRQAATVFAAAPSGWRNVTSGFQIKRFSDTAGETHEVRYRFGRGGLELPDHDAVRLVSATPHQVVLAVDGVDRPFDVARYGPDRRTCSSTHRSARCNSSRCRASRIRRPRSRTVRCSRRCRVRCCASAPRSATPSPRASR